MSIGVPSSLAGLGTFVAIVAFVLTVVVHIVFALAVFKDTSALVREGKRLVLVGPRIWSAATLVGGVFVATAYWVMHRSTLQSGLEVRRAPFRSGSGPSPAKGPGSDSTPSEADPGDTPPPVND